MIRLFLLWTLLFVIVGGFFLHYDAEIPYLMEWLGKLPGDMYLRKGNVIIFFPFTSAALASLVISVMLSSLKRKHR